MTRAGLLLALSAIAGSPIWADSPKGLAILNKFDVEEGPLPPSDPFPAENLVTGTGNNWLGVPFNGEFTIVVWESEQAKIAMSSPHEYDQYVEVLKGELVMTDTEGNSATFRKGDRFVMQKGFQGTWHMTEDYRELVIVAASEEDQ